MSRYLAIITAAMVLSTLFAFAGGQQGEGSVGAQAATTGEYGESPALAAMVDAGILPPVKERLPESPKVSETIEEIGTYGGQINVFAVNINRTNDMQNIWGATLFRVPRHEAGIEPDVAAGHEISADRKVFTLYLREGLKWSDGEPLLSEDIRFAQEDMHWNDKVNTWNRLGMVNEVKVVDDYTIDLICPGGVGLLPLFLSDWPGGRANTLFPSHYLKNWHADYNDDAQAIAEEEGFENWYDAMRSHYWWDPRTDVNAPDISPWVLRQTTTTNKVLERNPYFWRVDEARNQLPYIDRVVISIIDAEVYQLKVSGGAADIAYMHTEFENIPLYKSSEADGGYRTVLFPGASGSNVSLWINLNHPNPVLRNIYNDVKFRQAISVAIDRDDINDAVYMGLGNPRQLAPLSSSSFYKTGWEETYSQYDPALANRLLDEIGLDEKDSGGFRKRPDGETLSLVILYPVPGQTSALELVKEYWEKVGLKTTIKLDEWRSQLSYTRTSQHFAYTHINGNQPWAIERKTFQFSHVWRVGIAEEWDAWLNAKGKAVDETLEEGAVRPLDFMFIETPKDNELAGEKPPEWWLNQEELRLQWSQTDMGSPEYIELGQKNFDFWLEKIYKIGLVGEIPDVLIVNEKLGNVVEPGWVKGAALNEQLINEWYDQLFWKE
jgi:peptide/nickel transport system substrate-binding protein